MSQLMICKDFIAYPMMELKLNVSTNDIQGFYSLSNDWLNKKKYLTNEIRGNNIHTTKISIGVHF